MKFQSIVAFDKNMRVFYNCYVIGCDASCLKLLPLAFFYRVIGNEFGEVYCEASPIRILY